MMHFELYKQSSGTYHYRLIGDYFRFILMSEGYPEKEAALADIESARANLAMHDNIDVKTTVKDEYYFQIKNAEGRAIGTSCLFRTVQALNEKLTYIKPKIREVPVIEKL